ncbi:hypothetical protein HK100_000753, partial [Physocladia obscura]
MDVTSTHCNVDQLKTAIGTYPEATLRVNDIEQIAGSRGARRKGVSEYEAHTLPVTYGSSLMYSSASAREVKLYTSMLPVIREGAELSTLPVSASASVAPPTRTSPSRLASNLTDLQPVPGAPVALPAVAQRPLHLCGQLQAEEIASSVWLAVRSSWFEFEFSMNFEAVSALKYQIATILSTQNNQTNHEIADMAFFSNLSREAKIAIVSFVTAGIFLLEISVGYVTGSIALIADSFHMLSDLVALFIAFYAIRLAKQKTRKPNLTFGYQRAEILGAFANSVFLLALCFTIIIEAIQRFVNPVEIDDPKMVLVVGCVGLLANLLGMFLFGGHVGHGHGSVDDDQHGHLPLHSHLPKAAPTTTAHALVQRKNGSIHSNIHEKKTTVKNDGKGVEFTSEPADSISLTTTPPSPTLHYSAQTRVAVIAAADRIRKNTVSSDSESHHSRSYSNNRHQRHHSNSHSHSHENNGNSNSNVENDRRHSQVVNADQTVLNIKDSAPPSLHSQSHDHEHSNEIKNDHSHSHDYHGHDRDHEHEHESEHERENKNHDNHKHNHNHGDGGHGHGHGNMNMHGLFLHVLGDALGSVGVIISSLVIMFADGHWRYYMDPLISLLISGLIISSAVPLVRSASFILLQGVPTSVSMDKLKEEIGAVTGVIDVHELHVWGLSDSTNVASVHVRVLAGGDEGLCTHSYMGVAAAIKQLLHRYGVHSTTVQPEFVARMETASGEIVYRASSCVGGVLSVGGGGGGGIGGSGCAGDDNGFVGGVGSECGDEEPLGCLLRCEGGYCNEQVCCPEELVPLIPPNSASGRKLNTAEFLVSGGGSGSGREAVVNVVVPADQFNEGATWFKKVAPFKLGKRDATGLPDGPSNDIHNHTYNHEHGDDEHHHNSSNSH